MLPTLQITGRSLDSCGLTREHRVRSRVLGLCVTVSSGSATPAAIAGRVEAFLASWRTAGGAEPAAFESHRAGEPI